VKYTINKNINFTRFLNKLFSIIGNGGIVGNPKILQDLIEIRTNNNGEPIAIRINAKRITLHEPWDDKSKYFVDCTETISYDHIKKVNKHDKFTFNFEIIKDEEVELKKFRIDYNPMQQPPLHAHDYNYAIINNHLEYPKDLDLLLSAIDVVTVLLILDRYINNPMEYPLDNKYGKKYNGIISKTRVEYDDKF